MAIKSFDRYFLNLPELTGESDFDKFWEKSINDIKKIPIEPEVKENSRKSTSKFKVYDISYNGFLKTRIKGILYRPVNSEKSRVIIHLHDYNKYPDKNIKKTLSPRSAHLLLFLRGHEILDNTETNEVDTLGYMIENIIDLETYYARSVYLDTYRSIDFLRLIKFIDCSRIGIIGKGFGAAAGFFTAVHSGRVCAIVMDSPLFCNLPLSQNISQSHAASEINDIITIQRGKKNQIKKNLSYFDIINFSHKLTCPSLFVSGLNDVISPAECIMGLFNHIQSEKEIEIFPEDGNSAGNEKQFMKSLDWLTDHVLEN